MEPTATMTGYNTRGKMAASNAMMRKLMPMRGVTATVQYVKMTYIGHCTPRAREQSRRQTGLSYVEAGKTNRRQCVDECTHRQQRRDGVTDEEDGNDGRHHDHIFYQVHVRVQTACQADVDL